MRPLDPDNTRPLFLQVAAAIREAIDAGEYGPGQQLPARGELATFFGVAPMTVRNATKVLCADGVVVPRQGAGVFVRVVQHPGEASPDVLAVVDGLRADVERLRVRVEELAAALRPPES